MGIDTIIPIVTYALVLAGVIWFVRFRKSKRTDPGEAPVSQKTKTYAVANEPSKTRPKSELNTSHAVFISYRRQDSGDVTGRIYDRLVQHFGNESVFKDVDSIGLGIDFRERLAEALDHCNIFVAIIGKNWQIRSDGIQKGDLDFVQIEIESAFGRKIPVIPVLVQGATMPRQDELPASLGALPYRNAISVRPDPDFRQDMDRLIKGIEAHLQQRKK